MTRIVVNKLSDPVKPLRIIADFGITKQIIANMDFIYKYFKNNFEY